MTVRRLPVISVKIRAKEAKRPRFACIRGPNRDGSPASHGQVQRLAGAKAFAANADPAAAGSALCAHFSRGVKNAG
jgi:hypothetical protein